MRFYILQRLVLKNINEDLHLNIDTTLVFYSKGYITIFLCKNKGGLTVVKETNHALKFTSCCSCGVEACGQDVQSQGNACY